MKVDLDGKIALVTGAGGALGRAIAFRFAENGAHVIVCDVNREGGGETVRSIRRGGYLADFLYLDVTDRENALDAAKTIGERHGRLDILVNNAGINVGPDKRFPIDRFDDDAWQKIVDVDLNGVYNVSKAMIPLMPVGVHSNIVNIASIVGLVPLRNQCAFAAAKAGVVNLTRAMAIELAERAIRCNVIAPGSIMMEGTAKLFYADPEKAEAILKHIPQHRAGAPDDIAYAALYLAADEAGYVTGSTLTVDGGWTCGFARDF